MTDRLIDLSDEAARLSVRNGLLVIERGNGKTAGEVTMPLTDVAVVVVSHPGVSMSHAVLSGLACAGAFFVSCDAKRLPVAMLVPLVGHTTQSERFAQQVNASAPTKKRLWQQIVKAKITAQGRLLAAERGRDSGLLAMAKRVKSGDPDNLEAQATRRYFPALFGKSFKRDREAEDQNCMLNYGYAVLRAIVARAIAAAGLHPTVGIHHHNRYDCYCLADDLMEPFRPIVDAATVMWMQIRPDASGTLDKDAKAALLTALTSRVTMDGDSRTLFDAAARLASSCAAVFAGERETLVLPEAFDAPKRPQTD